MSKEAAAMRPVPGLLTDAAAVLGEPRVVLGGAFGVEPPAVTTRRVEAFLSEGGRLLETAVSYAGGRGMAAVGEVIASGQGPGPVDVVVKIGHGDRGVDLALDRAVVLGEVDRARDVLGMPCLAVGLLHNDDPGRPVGEIADTLAEVVDTGRARVVGASNWRADRLAGLVAALRERGHGPLVSYHRSLAVVDPARLNGSTWPGDDDLFATVDRAELPLLCWSANAAGYFARPDGLGSDADPFDHPVSRARRARCRQLAVELATDPATVALAWTLSRPGTWVSVGPSEPDRVRAAFAASRLRLTAEQVRWLRDG